ncbi:MAG: hypothetical protein AAGD38_13960 [Acidobacteriota bacterium]
MNRFVIYLVLSIALAATPTAHADEMDLQESAVAAIEAQRWDDAIRDLRQAIREEPDANVRRGLLAKRYTPHYYLGIALAESGDCRSALTELSISDRQTEIREVPEDYARLKTFRKRCQERLDAFDEASSQAREAISEAERAASSVVKMAQRAEIAPLWRSGSPSLADRTQRADSNLATARQRLEDARNTDDADMAGNALTLAQQASEEYGAVFEAANQQLDDRNRELSRATDELDQLRANAVSVVAALDDLRPFPPTLAGQVTAVEEATRTAEELTGRASSAADLEAVRTTLEGQLERLERTAGRPTRALVAAAEAYFAGDWQGVLDAIGEDRARSKRARDQRCLLGAAAGYALWVLDGELGEGPAAEALQEQLTSCSELDPIPVPTAPHFSPRFMTFFNETVLTPLGGLDDEEGEDGTSEDL